MMVKGVLQGRMCALANRCIRAKMVAIIWQFSLLMVADMLLDGLRREGCLVVNFAMFLPQFSGVPGVREICQLDR